MLHLTPARAAWGFPFRFESDDPALAAMVSHCYRDLPPAAAAPWRLTATRLAPALDRYRVSVVAPDGAVEECGEGRGHADVLELLCWEVNRRARASMADRVVLHASVIGGPRGAVALCGDSGSGKSTLCAAAAARGWWHLSDDLGLVDVDALTVTPYARPMMLRPGGREHLAGAGIVVAPPAEHLRYLGRDWFLPASDLGAVTVHDPQPLVAVCVLAWRRDASLEPLSRATVLHDLTIHSATVAAHGEAGFHQLARVAATVPGYRLGLGSAADALALLAPLVGAPLPALAATR